jgi:hypothetical protein
MGVGRRVKPGDDHLATPPAIRLSCPGLIRAPTLGPGAGMAVGCRVKPGTDMNVVDASVP